MGQWVIVQQVWVVRQYLPPTLLAGVLAFPCRLSRSFVGRPVPAFAPVVALVAQHFEPPPWVVPRQELLELALAVVVGVEVVEVVAL
jgi:hypothetical protein